MMKSVMLAGVTAFAFAAPLFANDITIKDAYARAAGTAAKTGAVFFSVENQGDTADTLIDVRTDVSKVAELHTHIAGDDGVMKMRKVESGFEVPAQGTHLLQRGGDHVMLMGLNRPLDTGMTFPLTLVFERSGEIVIEVPVDNDRTPEMSGGGHMGHDSK